MIYPITKLITSKISGEWGDEALEGSGVRVLRTTNFTASGEIDFDNVVFRTINERKVAQKHLLKGDIIIEKSGGGPKQPVGRVVFFDISSEEKYLCNNFTAILRPNLALVYPKYLFYCLRYLHLIGKTLRYQNKTTGILNLKLDQYLNEQINVPSIETQIQIASILSKAETLIKQRKESIELLDEFLRSTFFKMFGNKESFTKMKLVSACDFNPKKSEIANLPKEMEVSFIPMAAVSETGEVELSQKRALSKVWKGFTYFREGDVLFAKITPCMENGKGAIMYGLKNGIGFGSTEFHVLRPKPNLSNAEWLYHFTMQRSFRQEAEGHMSGSAGQKRVPSSFFENHEISVPPIELQDQFAGIVKTCNVINLHFRQSLFEFESLYGSLSQRFFKPTQDLEDKRYGDPFEVDEETAKAQGVEFYKEWRRLNKKQVKENIKDVHDNVSDKTIPLKRETMFIGSTGMRHTMKGAFRQPWREGNIEHFARRVKEEFKNNHFTLKELEKFLLDEVVTTIDYHSTEELKMDVKLDENGDFRAFIVSALDEQESNPYLQLQQVFYNAETKNIKLQRADKKEFEKLSPEQQSGLYFSIVK